ncbi:Aerotolerance protein BatB / Aerotolerance protein BatC [hydrothermal vent metagenome]|uniref:Aerotolerance protein BatB / Aerotolerance protein BatC n=1 Tax=hydrothermal vent metagenome TaxID=652676 RepID=A0A3B0WJ84_9ZZZZ
MNDLFNISMQEIISEFWVIQNNLHFIRSDWFYAFIPLIIFLFLLYKITLNNKNWSGVVDPQLIPFVLSKTIAKQRRYPLLLIFIAGSLCITALAGPVYKKLAQPVYREQSSLVVLLDLSQSMNASDIKPSRLSRAKLKLLDLLKTRKTGQTALIVYAADAFVVTPLTDDNATIANMVPSLETDMMPAQGSNLASALAKTFSLLTQAGVVSGNILVITDDIHQRDKKAIKKVFSQGHRLSIFGIGTIEGAPIPLGGAFLKNSSGAIVIPKLQPTKLQRDALNGGGLYVSLQTDDSDIDKLAALFQSSNLSKDRSNNISAESQTDMQADIWQEEGHWLLLPLIFFAAFWARKGWLAGLLIFIFSVTTAVPQQAYAETSTSQDNNADENFSLNNFDTKNLWSSSDQKAMKAFNNGNVKKAAENFTQKEWKASAFYRDGNYEAAAKILKGTETSDGFYNKGNALAKLGKYEDAINAYEKSLEIDEDNDDAKHNIELVKQALKEQKKENQSQDNDKDQQDDQSDDSQQNDSENKQQDGEQNSDQSNDPSSDPSNDENQKQNSEQENSQSSNEQSSENSSDESSNENDNEQQSGSESKSKEQQEKEQEQLKQRDAQQEAEQQKQEDQQYQQDQKKKEQRQEEQKNAEKEVEHKNSNEKPMDVEVNPMEASITEEEKATEQWLKRIPDDPGGLLRRKFYYQYKQVPNQADSAEPW